MSFMTKNIYPFKSYPIWINIVLSGFSEVKHFRKTPKNINVYANKQEVRSPLTSIK